LDLANDLSVRACFAEPVDAVIHLAAIALSRAADRDPALAWSINAEGTGRLTAALADAAARWKTKPLFLLASTADIYAWQKRPIKEEDCVQHPLPIARASSARSSRPSRSRAVVAEGHHRAAVSPLRRGQDESFWIPARCRILREAKRNGWAAVPVGDLTAVRDYLHVDDVADAYACCSSAGRRARCTTSPLAAR